MATVELRLPHHRYEIRIEPGALQHLGEWVSQTAPHGLAMLLADETVMPLYGAIAQQQLTQSGYELLTHTVGCGEDHKNLDTIRSLYDRMIEARLERHSPVIALGGGVIGDTAGFAASTYLRGVPFIQCPTTLLAMVDAAVGGKVGVNLPQGKNLIGSFHQPRLVVIDTDTLRTLPTRELRCGLAECVKHAVIRDPSLFDWIDQNLDAILSVDPAVLVELVRRNVQIKADVVMEDEKEAGLRAHLNFGHTFAHAIEATAGYGGRYHHGEAVSLGMVAATHLATQAARCEPGVLDKLVQLLDRIGLPTHGDDLAPTDQLLETMGLDKKVVGGQVRLVLPDRLGRVSVVADTPTTHIENAWEFIGG